MKKSTLSIAVYAVSFLLLPLFGGIGMSYAQDVRFTQQFANPLRLNPAIMGSNNDLKAILNYRSQWGTINKGYSTASFSFLYPLFLKPELWKMDEGKSKLDFGLNVLNDKAGAFNNIDIMVAVGYGLRVSSSHFLSLSLSGGFVQQSLSAADQTFDEQYVLGTYNAANPSGQAVLNQKGSYIDAGFGAMWNYFPENAKVNAYAGIAGFHLNQPNETFTDGSSALPSRFSYQAGVKILGDNKMDFTPNVIVNNQNGTKQLMIGILTDYRIGGSGKMVLGMWYREKDAIAFQVGYEHKSFLFGYSYDFSHAEITKAIAQLSTHEIALAYKLNMTGKKELKTNPSIF